MFKACFNIAKRFTECLCQLGMLIYMLYLQLL